MEIKTVKTTKTIETEIERYVCSDGQQFDLSLKEEAEKHQELLDIKATAKDHLIFAETEAYELVYVENKKHALAYYGDKWTNVFLGLDKDNNTVKFPAWFSVEWMDGGDYNDEYTLTPIQDTIDEIEEVKELIAKADVDKE